MTIDPRAINAGIQTKEALLSELSLCIRTLLEQKHLYQNLDLKGLIRSDKEILEKYSDQNHKALINSVRNNIFSESWILSLEPDQLVRSNTVVAPSAEMFCKECERRQAFNPLSVSELLADALKLIPGQQRVLVHQIFVIVYQCQSCKSLPEAVIIRRDALKLSIHGRSPIEQIEVPDFIPREITLRKHYSNALLAFNSGQTLAGIFQLRVFVEQFCRKVTSLPTTRNIEEILDTYFLKLEDEHFKASFPSLRKVYDDLSNAIHEASESVELFNLALSEINRHFEGLRAFRIDPLLNSSSPRIS